MTVHELPVKRRDIPVRDERDWVTAIELCTEAGITYRQLDYWTRTDLLTPLTEALPGSGHFRIYSETELARALALRDLLDAGISLQVIRDVIDQVLAEGQVQVGHITFTYQPEGAA